MGCNLLFSPDTLEEKDIICACIHSGVLFNNTFMVTVSNAKATSPAFLRRRKYFIFSLGFGIVLIFSAFIFYKILIGKAFADRGRAESIVPEFYSTNRERAKEMLLESVQKGFNCAQKNKFDVAHFNSVGMFPYLLKNGPQTCNKASDFVGYKRFIDAMLYGEDHLGEPATASSSKSLNFNHHHPGLGILENMIKRGEKYDRSVEFYWWMFPVPMGTPNRGFAYAIFQGDFNGLREEAKTRNLNFDSLFLDGLKVFMKLQGWDIETSRSIESYSYDEKDHIVTKAWISLKCFSEYRAEGDNLFYRYKINLENFMKIKNIRYPKDFPCI